MDDDDGDPAEVIKAAKEIKKPVDELMSVVKKQTAVLQTQIQEYDQIYKKMIEKEREIEALEAQLISQQESDEKNTQVERQSMMVEVEKAASTSNFTSFVDLKHEMRKQENVLFDNEQRIIDMRKRRIERLDKMLADERKKVEVAHQQIEDIEKRTTKRLQEVIAKQSDELDKLEFTMKLEKVLHLQQERTSEFSDMQAHEIIDTQNARIKKYAMIAANAKSIMATSADEKIKHSQLKLLQESEKQIDKAKAIITQLMGLTGGKQMTPGSPSLSNLLPPTSPSTENSSIKNKDGKKAKKKPPAPKASLDPPTKEANSGCC